MARVICPNCKSEVILPEKSEVVFGQTISKETRGNYVLPMEQNNNNIKKEENKTMNNNMNGLDLNVLAQMVAAQLKGDGVQTQTVVQNTSKVDLSKLNNSNAVDKNHWAENSQFHGEEICGYAYNPYMIRRFLPAQFQQLMLKYNYNVYKGITREYPYMYSITYTLEEVRKLAMLNKRDKIAYDERKLVFTLPDCRHIFVDYINDILAELNKNNDEFVKYNRVGKECKAGFKGYGWMPVGTVAEKIEKHKVVKYLETTERFNKMIEDLKELKVNIYRCYTYEQLYKLMSSRELMKVPAETKKSKSFMDCFIKAGSYYTLKQNLMFNDYISFEGLTGRAAVIHLRSYLEKRYEGYKIYAMLKKVNGIR